MAQDDRKCLQKLQSMYQDVNWKINKERKIFLLQFCKLISVWTGQLPNLRDIFMPEQIDWLLIEYVNNYGTDRRQFPFIEFVVRTGYKDVPRIDENGKPSSRRTSAVHQAMRYYTIAAWNTAVRYLFEIYDRFDVNYTDELGRTHFLAACLYNCEDVVKKFLELGEDPNYIWPLTSYSPLLLALKLEHNGVAELLLRNGANPNYADKHGSTALHYICREKFVNNELAEMLFEISEEKNHLVQIDTLNNRGRTPLHLVAERFVNYPKCDRREYYEKMIQLLLRKGANPNLANPEGSTVLHIITKRWYEYDLAEVFFKICDDNRQFVQIDARDKLGQTPLQCAVANVLTNTVDFLLDKGADLSSITFPPDDYFSEKKKTHSIHAYAEELRKVSGILIIVGHFEKRGYELSRTDVLRLMKFFTQDVVFEESWNSGKCWYDEEEFATKAKEMSILPGLSLHDFVKLRPKKATKLFVNTDYLNTMSSDIFYELRGGLREACFLHLYEVVCRGFFRRWALDSLLELTRYRLPILCCEMINDQLINQELFRICLAAAGQSFIIVQNILFFNV